MQFQVPQFIDTEDKVVGPFSLRQFLYVGVAGVLSAICYFILQTWLFAIFAIILVGGSFAISFIKIQGRPLAKVITSAANFYWHPQTYVWQSEHTPIAPRALEPERGPGMSTELEKILTASPLHKSWQELQTGSPAPDAPKQSDKQFLEQKMEERYQIFQRQAGDRAAARRIDYR